MAFGDDAAAAGGLVTWVDETPWFIGDAAADPISGVTAAVGVLGLWSQGRGGRVDVAMRDAVAHMRTVHRPGTFQLAVAGVAFGVCLAYTGSRLHGF